MWWEPLSLSIVELGEPSVGGKGLEDGEGRNDAGGCGPGGQWAGQWVWECDCCVSYGDSVGGIPEGPGNGDDKGCFGSPGVVPVARAPLDNWMIGYGIVVLWEWACGVGLWSCPGWQ